MRNIYIKTTWVDNKTPVNASNLNKIENAIADLYSHAVSASELTQGNGINIMTTAEKKLEFSVSDKVMQSDTCKSIEIVDSDSIPMENGKMYFIIDSETKKLKKIMFNGVVIYEVE